MQTLETGENATTTTTWWNDDQAPVEPSAISLTITKPSGATIVKAKGDLVGSAGTDGDPTLDTWKYTYLVDENGVWLVDTTGTVDDETIVKPTVAFLVDAGAVEGPCEPWCTWDDVDQCGTINWTTEPNAAQRELWIDQASEILWNLSGRAYSGVCVATRSLCNSCSCARPRPCGCDPYPGLDLGGGVVPVWGVLEVVIDGEVLAPTAYRVVSRRWLVRTDGSTWPSGYPTADPDRFRVRWAFGRRVPGGGRSAAAYFASQIAKRCTGDKTCALPQRVTQINREGVTFTVLDSMKMIEEGRTGLELVDLWLVSNQKGRRPPARMFHPAAAGMRRF